MKIILAMDNDQAGYQAVWRFLERHAGNPDVDCFPMPSPDDMSIEVYKLWIQSLLVGPFPISDLTWELHRLKEKDDADDIDKVAILLKGFLFLKEKTERHARRHKYLKALGEAYRDKIGLINETLIGR